MTTYTDEQLKRALAKMLPDTVGFIGYSTTLLYKPSGAKVLDTELLYLCSLVEETFDDDQWKSYCIPLGGRDISWTGAKTMLHASWQQRTIALAKVKGVEIV